MSQIEEIGLGDDSIQPPKRRTRSKDSESLNDSLESDPSLSGEMTLFLDSLPEDSKSQGTTQSGVFNEAELREERELDITHPSPSSDLLKHVSSKQEALKVANVVQGKAKEEGQTQLSYKQSNHNLMTNQTRDLLRLTLESLTIQLNQMAVQARELGELLNLLASILPKEKVVEAYLSLAEQGKASTLDLRSILGEQAGVEVQKETPHLEGEPQEKKRDVPNKKDVKENGKPSSSIDIDLD